MMQAYAEGWELLEKVDLVDNVTEVFRSWREGTVIRSWLLDLLVAALDDDPQPVQDPRLRRGLRRGPLDRRGRHRQRRRRCRRSPPRCSPGSSPARTTRPAMKAVAAMRNQFGGHAVKHRAAARRRRADRRSADAAAVHVAHLALHDFRSYADVDVALEPGVTAFIGRNGQGKTNLVEAIDYLSRLASHRVATDAPLVRAGAEQAVVRAAVVRDGRHRGARGRDQPRPGQPGPGQQVAAAPHPRPDRPGAHGGLLPRGPRPWSRATRPTGAASSTTCWCCARRGWPASAPTTSGSCASATRCSRPPALRAAAPSQRRSRRSRRSASGTPTWPASAPSCWPRGCALVDDLRPYVGKAYATVARGAAARRRPSMDYKASVDAARRRARATEHVLAEALLAELAERRGDELDRGITLVGPHRDDWC